MIRILVDSASDYSPYELKKKNITLVPINIMIDDKTYRDCVDLTCEEFYEILTASKEFPKTSQPSPAAFLDIFEEAKENGDDILYLSVSSALSGTFQSANLAKSMVEYDRIHIIDTLNVTATIRIMADYACYLRNKGTAIETIVKRMETLKSHVKVFAAVDTLEYLGKGGRISKAAAAIGNLTNIKPIITATEEGTVGIIAKCLGKNKAINALITQTKNLFVDDRFPVYTIFSYGTENCQRFEEKLEKEGIHITSRCQIGPTIGTHIGPEAFGIVFVAR